MSDVTSALDGRAHDGRLKLREDGPRGMITVRGDLSGTHLHRVASGLAAVDFPGEGKARCVGQKGLLWMSPDELMLMVAYNDVPSALGQLDGLDGHYLAADVSDARAVMILEGGGWRDVLARLAPADVRAMGPGDFRRTRLGQVAAGFWVRDAGRVELICFRSVAEYVWGLLVNAIESGPVLGD